MSWTSGPCLDPRPQFNPAVLVIEVQRLLRERGLVVDPDPNMLFTAGLAACDLLRALGVRPAIAPERAR